MNIYPCLPALGCDAFQRAGIDNARAMDEATQGRQCGATAIERIVKTLYFTHIHIFGVAGGTTLVADKRGSAIEGFRIDIPDSHRTTYSCKCTRRGKSDTGRSAGNDYGSLRISEFGIQIACHSNNP